MKVYELLGNYFSKRPQIKISNKKLLQSGFKPGDNFTVEYGNGTIILRVDKQEK